MNGKLGGFVVTAAIVLLIVAVAYRVSFLKKIVFGG